MIKRQIDRSLADGETNLLARKIVSGRYDYVRDPANGQNTAVIKAWGMLPRAPSGGLCSPRDALCEVTKVWEFVVLNLRYTFDPGEPDLFMTVEESLSGGGGDCDDAAIMFAALLKSIGFTVILRVISTNGSAWEHIYAMVGVPHDRPTQWIALDPTVAGKPMGWEYEAAAAYRDFPA